jgi:hypothetical protein
VHGRCGAAAADGDDDDASSLNSRRVLPVLEELWNGLVLITRLLVVTRDLETSGADEADTEDEDREKSCEAAAAAGRQQIRVDLASIILVVNL